MKTVPPVSLDDKAAVRRHLQKLASSLGPEAVPTHAGLTLTGLTASTLLGANASKLLESVTVGTGLDYTRPTLSLSHLGIEALTDPNVDKILFWDDTASACAWLGMGNSIAITTTTIDTIQDIRTSASPQFTGIELGHATDTTITRVSAGDLNIEGNIIYRAGGTDVPLTDGGTGASSTVDARTNLGLVIGTDVQAWDAGLDSLATLTYVSDSFIKVTATDTYAIRTIAETKTDLSLNLVENTAHSTDAHTMTIDGRDVSVDGTKLDGIEALADVTATHETSHALVLVDGDFGSAGLMNTDGAGTYSIKAIGTDVQAYHANLAAIAGGTWTGANSITTLGTIATVGNITIANGGTIGNGVQLNFDDTNDYLEIMGCDVGLGTITPTWSVASPNKVLAIEYAGDGFPVLKLERTGGTAKVNRAWSMTVGSTGTFSLHDVTSGNSPFICEPGAATATFFITAASLFGIGTAPVTKLTVQGTLTLREQAVADADTAAYGQIWCKTATPNTLWFTDDAGTDFQLSGIATGVLNHSFTYDPPNIANGAYAGTSVTVTGAAFGDFVLVSFSANVFNLVLTGEVTSANIVTIVFANNTGAARDLASGTVYIRVLKK